MFFHPQKGEGQLRAVQIITMKDGVQIKYTRSCDSGVHDVRHTKTTPAMQSIRSTQGGGALLECAPGTKSVRTHGVSDTPGWPLGRTLLNEIVDLVLLDSSVQSSAADAKDPGSPGFLPSCLLKGLKDLFCTHIDIRFFGQGAFA